MSLGLVTIALRAAVLNGSVPSQAIGILSSTTHPVHQQPLHGDKTRPTMGFKVIIVGGGLAGLGLAHCLTKAGIDFLVLERGDDLTPPGGASLAMWPHNVRVLDQLGLLKGMEEIDCNIKYKCNVKRDGKVMQKSNMLEHAGKS